MSQVEEDPELRELVTEALEKSGVLAAVRAHLRAGVFLALEREHDQSRSHHVNLKQMLNTHEGRLTLLLVHELLEFCRLRHTASVFCAETGQPHTYVYKGRDALMCDFQLSEFAVENSHLPILVQLISVLFKLAKTSTFGTKTNGKTQSEAYVDPVDNNVQNEDLELNTDNYDTTFTSDSTNHSSRDGINKDFLQLNLNLNGLEVEKASSDHVEDRKSFRTDAHIEIHTDSDKSLSDVNSITNREENLTNRSVDTSEKSNNTKRTDQNSKESITNVLPSNNSNLQETLSSRISNLSPKSDESVYEETENSIISVSNTANNKNDLEIHQSHSNTSQRSDKVDLSGGSVSEEIVQYENSENIESNINSSLSPVIDDMSSSNSVKQTSEDSSVSFSNALKFTEPNVPKLDLERESDESESKSSTKGHEVKLRLEIPPGKNNATIQKHNSKNKVLKKSSERQSDLTVSKSKRLPNYSGKINSEKSTKSKQIDNTNGSE